MTTKSFELRNYQIAAIQAVRKDWAAGIRSVLVTAASGTGKTETFLALLAAELESHPTARALIICHRRDLIDQAQKRLELRFPQWAAKTGVVMATQDEADKQIVISTIQTLAEPKRLQELLSYGPIDYLIRDEAHRAVTPSDRKVVAGLRKANPALLHLGVTATPIRADGKGLVDAYEHESYHYGIKEAVEQASLVPPRWLAVSTGISLDEATVANGDYTNKSLADVYETTNCFDLVVDSHRKFADGRQAMAFTASVDGAYTLAATFRREGYRAAAADGSTKSKERAQILADFRAGKLDVLCNCQLYTEGLDVPSVSCVHQVRPTKSDGAYIQMVGRGLRTAPGKTDCLILDYAPLDCRNIVMLGDVLGVPARKDVYMKAPKEVGEVIGGFTFDGRGTKWLVGNPDELLSRELDYLDAAKWIWYRGEDGWLSLSLGTAADGIDRILIMVPDDQGYVLYGVAKMKSGRKAFQLLAGELESLTERADQAVKEFGDSSLVKKGKSWRKQAPSEAQRSYARTLGIPVGDQSKGVLAQRITHEIGKRLVKKLRC